MSGDEIYRSSADRDTDANKSSPFRFAPISVAAMVYRENGKARKHADAILPALIMKIVCEGILHLRQTRQFRHLVNTLSALNAPVNFLQADQIGMLPVDDFS